MTFRVARRAISTCAKGLRPLEDGIGLGLRARLAALGEVQHEPARVAVAGQSSPEFIATLRAARAAGAAVAPIDSAGRSAKELCELLAEAQVQLAVSVGPAGEAAVMEAARLLGASTASSWDLQNEGSSCSASSSTASAPASAPLLLFVVPPPWAGSMPRAAEVQSEAFGARVQAAVTRWGLNQHDTVLSLGLQAERDALLVDALEAPLFVGASVAMPESRWQANDRIWDFWAAVHEHAEATLLFVDMKWCRQLLDSYQSLAPGIKRELSARWEHRPFRHAVAVASFGTTLSKDLAETWHQVFKVPLTWHFSCAEAGSLFTVCGTHGVSSGCREGLEWRVDSGELRVRGQGMFTRYHGRPRSTEEAFDEEGFFCRTGHRVSMVPGGMLQPEPRLYDFEAVEISEKIYSEEPNQEPYPRMVPDWKVKKVPIRKYDTWRTAWGGHLLTKKHNQADKIYKSKWK